MMKAQVEKINSVQRRLHIEIPPEKVAEAFDKAFAQIQKRAKVQGFRPGKAPLYMIKKIYGDQVGGDVSYNLVNSHVFEALKAENIAPVSQPVLEEMPAAKLGEPFKFTAVVDVMPEIQISNYKNHVVAAEDSKVATADVEKELEFLQRRA